MPLVRDRKTASESEALRGQPTSFEKVFRFVKNVLQTVWGAG
jgi:hypothetical protein